MNGRSLYRTSIVGEAGSRGEARFYRVLDYSFLFRSRFPPLAEVVNDLFGRWEVDFDPGPSTTYIACAPRSGAHKLALLRDDELVQPGSSMAPILDFLLWDVYVRAVETTSYIALHAAAASWGDDGLLMPAAMDAGKTTLVAGLIRAGFDYLSDEAALIDPADGDLHPFTKPLWMEPPTVDLLPPLKDNLPWQHRAVMQDNFHVTADRLRPDPFGRPCRVRWIIAPRYSPGSSTRLDVLGKADALMLLASNSFNGADFGGGGVETLARVVRLAHCYRLTIGDLGSAVKTISDLVRWTA